jgi:hypothetical protein
MSKLFRFAVGVIFLAILSVYANAITTGELIAMDKRVSEWPPLILQRPEMQHVFDTENFRIHYDTEGENEVYHSDEDINPPDGVPDYINVMAGNLETARYIFLNEMGYDRPPPDEGFGGDDRYDIYVTQISGLTVPEFRSDYYPDRFAYAAYSYIGNDLRNIHHPNTPYPFMMATCVHEYFHAVQMAYRGYTSDETYWWYELTAMWAEERVFDGLNEVYYYLDDYYYKINRSIYLTGGAHPYGAWVFAEYLSQNYGDGIIKIIFEELIDVDYSLDAIINVLEDYQLNINTEFTLFSCWNYFTAGNSKPGFFEEAPNFPVTVPVFASHYNYPVPWQDSEYGVGNLGASFIRFENPDIDKGKLVVVFESDPYIALRLGIAKIYNNDHVDITTRKVNESETVELSVDGFDQCNSVVLAIIGSYEGFTIEDSANYRYYAYIDTSVVDIDIKDLNKPGEFKLAGNYPNPFNLSTQITFYWNFEPSEYTIHICDLAGRRIDVLSGQALPGENGVNWKANKNLASGVYLYKLTVGGYSAAGRMLLLK